MKFRLTGSYGWTGGSCENDRVRPLDNKFVAENKKSAIKVAKTFITRHYQRRSHLDDFWLKARLKVESSGGERKLKDFVFRGIQPATPGYPARKAIPERLAVPAHFE